MGDDEPRKFCHINCNGQGPVVSVNPQQISWGEVTLLQLYTKELKITNDAPITASFEALLVSYFEKKKTLHTRQAICIYFY